MIQTLPSMDDPLVPQLLELGNQFYPLSKLSGAFHADTFKHYWARYLEMGLGKIFVHVTDSRVDGALGLLVSMSLADGAVLAEEAFWFVDPACRGVAGIRLFQAAEDWAKQSGANRMLVGYLCDSMPAKVEAFYEHRGYRRLQVQYSKDL